MFSGGTEGDQWKKWINRKEKVLRIFDDMKV